MAVQAQLYSENLGFPLGGGGGGSQDLLFMDNHHNGFNEFSFNNQQQQNQNPQMQFHQQLQNMQQISSTNRPEINPLMVFDQALLPQVKKQRLDIDGLINLQNERLRLVLQEQRKQQLAMLLKKYESQTQILLRQKDEEIAKAVTRTMELQDFLSKIETENQAWQRVARENEAIIMTLNNTMDQIKANNAACQLGGNRGGVDDAESCCEETRRGPAGGGTLEGTEQENEEQRRRKLMICKSCNSRNSCVILLPCRHLCSCKVCEAYISSCPVCKMAKKGSIEALI
ncbi:hypothetical protein M9H77_33825 [Catharanthus roseus]|uniref:Uncharacterized protein n=1 Tax=Catharanthus roseus TaxID=4058 RepID=A0ACB9ZK87_CATRO|nr:hypothetical protein M9H77_33825 [Catharanthus roseus]